LLKSSIFSLSSLLIVQGVKGDIKEGETPPPPPGAGIFTEEKQRELQADLEKQFTLGLRRRDGRTVGLGL
jgi:hypothetical protein